MRDDIKEKIEELVFDELDGDDYEKVSNYGEYEVYKPVYKSERFIGYPLVVLVKGETVRLSTNEEAMEICPYVENEEKENDFTGKGVEYRQNTSYDDLK